MTRLRKFIYVLTATVAAVTLVQIPFAISVTNLFSDSEKVGNILQESKAYDQLVPSVIDQVRDSTDDAQTKQLLGDKEVRAVIEQSIPPKVIEDSANSILDGVYSWLEGKTAQPEFSINLTEQRDELVQNLSAHIEQRTAKLPNCTFEQLQTIDVQNNLLTLPCRPPGVEPKQIATQFTNNIVSQVEFLKDPVVDSKKVLDNQDAQKALQDTKNVPQLYESLQLNKWWLVAQAIVLLALLVFARRDRLAGVRIVGKLLIGTGIFLGVLVLMQSFSSVSTETMEPAKAVALNALSLVLDEMFQLVRWFSIGYFAAGFAILFYLHHRDNTPTELPQTNSPKTPDTK